MLPAAAPPPPLAVVHYRPNGKLAMLRVRIAGTPLWFTVDTGAPHTVVDAGTARRLGIRIVSTDREGGAGAGTVARAHGAPFDVYAGGVRLRVSDPWILDLSHVGTALHQDGLLGADFFAAYVVRLDPVRQTLTVYDPASFRYAGRGAAIPMTAPKNRLFIRMTLSLANGISAAPEVRIDTGSEDAVSDDLVKRSPERRQTTQGVGLGRPFVDYSGVFERVAIGPYAIERVWGPSSHDPAVGMEILRRFTMTFDVGRRVLYLEPNAGLREPVPSPAP